MRGVRPGGSDGGVSNVVEARGGGDFRELGLAVLGLFSVSVMGDGEGGRVLTLTSGWSGATPKRTSPYGTGRDSYMSMWALVSLLRTR